MKIPHEHRVFSLNRFIIVVDEKAVIPLTPGFIRVLKVLLN